jgi:hypothetical protein
LSAFDARQPRAQRIKRRRNRDLSVFLFLHSGEGKKCFHHGAKLILRNCWRLLGDTEQILASNSFHRCSLLAGKQPPAARKRLSAAHAPATAAAMIITHRGDMSSLTGADLFALKSNSAKFKGHQLVRVANIGDA